MEVQKKIPVLGMWLGGRTLTSIPRKEKGKLPQEFMPESGKTKKGKERKDSSGKEDHADRAMTQKEDVCMTRLACAVGKGQTILGGPGRQVVP